MAQKTPKEKEKFIPLNPGKEGDDPPEGNKLSLGKFRPVIMPIILALAVSYFLITVMAVPKGTYNNAIMGLTGRVASVETSIEEVITGQEAISASIQSLEEELANFDLDTGEIDDLAVKVNSLEAQVAGLNMSSINSQLDAFDKAILNLEKTVEALEPLIVEPEEEEEPELGETTRWSKDFYSTNYGVARVTMDCHFSPSKIEEEDDYTIRLYLANQTETPITNCIMELAITPRTGDRVIVDENKLFLDTTNSPYYLWDMEIVKRSDGSCRRVLFTSSKIGIPKTIMVEGEVEELGLREIRLEFTLAYK